MAQSKRKGQQTRNPVVVALRSPIFKQKGHGRSAKIYDRKRKPNNFNIGL